MLKTSNNFFSFSLVLCLCVALFFSSILAGNIAIKDSKPAYVPGEILVKFKKDSINVNLKQASKQMRTFSQSNDLSIQSNFNQENIVLMKTTKDVDLEDKIAELESDSSVEYAEPNYLYYTQSNDEYYSQLWALSKISRASALPFVNSNQGITTGSIVAVIDVGVDYTHPDLTANMRDGSACVSDTGASLGGCQHGYDFIDMDTSPLPATSTHGTHVAGILAATMDNIIGVAGVNPYAKIMALRAGDHAALTSSSIIQSINFAKQNGAKIINASFGGAGYSSILHDAIQSFSGLFVTAAGNSTQNHETTHLYPCDYNLDNIICVAATDSNDQLWTFSDYGISSVDVAAPGVSITGTVVNMSMSQFLENYESSLSGSFPGTWTKSAGQNDWGITQRADSFGKVFSTNPSKPYAANANTYIQKTFNLSGVDGAELEFDVGCDTEYITSGWTDYLTLSISRDGIHFDHQEDIDEAWIDSIVTGTAGDSGGTATVKNLLLNLTGYYQTSGFTVRFGWITNANDNDYEGCFVDNLTINKYTRGADTYQEMNGTSMATPYVAGLASLAWASNPTLSYQTIKNAILYSGDYLTGLSGKILSSRRINAHNTLLSLGDTTSPSITISTPSANVTGSTIQIQGTGSDLGGLSQVVVNNQIASGTTNRSQTVSLDPGVNIITVTGIDYAGNTSVATITLTRVPYTSNSTSKIINGTTTEIKFNSDILSTGFVSYGTGELTDTVSGGEEISHTIMLSNLLPNTDYIYQIYSVYQGITGQLSLTLSFHTPDIFEVNGGSDKVTTGSVFLNGFQPSGIVFSGLAILSINASSGSSVQINTSGLVITVNSGVWDGLIHGPLQTGFVGTTPSFTNYTHVPGLTFEVGNEDVSLMFSGSNNLLPQVSLFVGVSYNTKILKIFKSEDHQLYQYAGDCTVNNGLCVFTTNSFSSFTLMSPNTTSSAGGSNGGGGGGGSSSKEQENSIPTKTGLILSGDVVKVSTMTYSILSNPNYSNEFNQAYYFAYQNGITTQVNIDKADMKGSLIRSHLAKMISNYAIKVLGKTPDLSKKCTFTDISNESAEMRLYIKTSCQLGLMGQNTTEFNSHGTVNRAQFSTILSRLLYGSTNEGGSPYYTKHISALKKSGIIANTTPDLEEIRGYVMLMLMRSQIVQ